MAFENNQQEPSLPAGDKNYKRKSANHLPKYFRTEFNNKFLNATLDQMLQPGVAEKLNVFYGRKNATAFSSTDNYVGDVNPERENYQLEPASVIKDDLGNVDFYADYNDYINKLTTLSGATSNHSSINAQEYYAWNPHIDWDKFVNFREYYWLPTGPDSVNVYGQSKAIQSTYTVGLRIVNGDPTYLLTPDGLTNNPSLTLYRGQTYIFDVNAPSYPIAFATQRSYTPGRLPTDGQQNTSLIYDTGVTKVDADGNATTETWLDEGTITFTVPDTAPDTLYYVSKGDANVAGTIKVNDIIENTEIDIDKEIIGKKTYKTGGGWDFSNGMKVQFVGNVTPAKYATGEWYVEGVGEAIQLIKQEDLAVSGLFTQDIEVAFDAQEFDFYPFSEALGFPKNKDYIIINRGSKDGNLWSRYNRWFHKDVIEKTATLNGQVSNVDQSTRASRPIIEFNKGLKLYNFGTESKENINLIDTKTVDAFSYIEGTTGYNIDGVDLTEGMRVLFTADTDTLVNGRIFKVKFIKINNSTQISLIEETDSTPQENETVLVTQGNINRGKYFYYDGTSWKAGQDKTSVNQQPMFDMFNSSDKGFADSTAYESSLFTGNKVFSYTVGTGTNDTELGFPLSYRSITNSGDILFSFNLLNETFTYTLNNALYKKSASTGFLRKYEDRTTYVLQNGWQKADKDSTQNVIRQYIATADQTVFALDMYDNILFINDVWLRVFVNNTLQVIDQDFTITSDANGSSFITFVKKLKANDNVIIKTRSKYEKNENGYYEIASNLEKNPLNNDINQFTLGEVNDHLRTIVEESNEFSGAYPGVSNLRDIGGLTKLGKKFLKHSSPINFSLYHLLDNNANIIKAISSARLDYSKFKRLFLETADTLGYEGPVREHVDKIIAEVNKDKVNSMPYYFSDMIPQGGTVVNSTTIEDTDQKFFALSAVFSMSTPSTKAVQIYKNGLQLTHGVDYTFNTDGFAVITCTKQLNDVIDIIEYTDTNGSYVAPTPTKLGLYPSFVPEIYIDTTVQSTPPAVATGAYKLYGIAGPDQNGAGKLGWYYPLYTTLAEAQTRDTELGGSGQAHVHTFTGLNRPFYMPNTGAGHGLQDTTQYEEWVEGSVVIQGHDGSKTVAYKDFRDNLLLELERRIFNNLKVAYDKSIFDINDYQSGLNRSTGITKVYQDNALIAEFLSWSRLVDLEYSKHTYYDRQNRFTFNYSRTNYPNNTSLPGWWRQAFIYAFDTDRPHTHPWEMLGFSIKPTWWETQYGKAPYTRNNLLLWEDLEGGIIRQPSYTIDKKYIRPGLTTHIPVDQDGNLLSPNDCGLALNLNIADASGPFNFGDGGPVESAWRRSSEFPFALIRSFILNKPSKAFATGFDRIRQKRNLADQIIYGDTEKQVQLSTLVFPTTVDDTTQVFTSGFINYIYDYQFNLSRENIDVYKNNLSRLRNQIGFKIGGFTDKNKFKLILDSRTPLNEGNVFVPNENYSIFLNSSFPTKEISYSGVIVEKFAEGYYVKGYDNQNPTFKYYPVLPKQADPAINVGGVSEPFVTWSANKTYAVGTIVKSGSDYYRSKETHTSGTDFDLDKFVAIPELPVTGGRSAYLRRSFSDQISILNYGTLFTTIQDVVDFLLGYGNYLERIGFSFSSFRNETYEVSDWQTSVREFLYWTTQNWGEGTVLSLSPGAGKINFKSEYATSDNVLEPFYGYSIFKADGKVLEPTNLKFSKDTENNFSVRTINTEDGIYSIKIPLVVKEHVVLIDNTTVFGDIIYDVEPGYRQERIKVLGYRTGDWNGSLNIPGFIYDDAKVTLWEAWKDYSIGDLVKYKEFYYTAKNKVAGNSTFVNEQWVRLDEQPEAGLYANFDYKVNQFADFYDLDSDNFDSEQQKLAQHLIGYQKRKYLENIVNDDVSQYKFYQGFIQDKGTKNALTKLFDALSSADKDSLEFYEEWGIKDGQYGASDGFEEVEYLLDESKFRLSPQPILLTNTVTGKETDLIYRIQDYETYLRSKNYNHKPFPTKLITDGYTKDSGYVNPDDVNFVLGTYDSLLNLDIDKIKRDDYVWVGNVNFDWSVYQYKNSGHDITSITKADKSFTIQLSSIPADIKVGDIVGILEVTNVTYNPEDSTQQATFAESTAKGFYKVKNITLDKIEFDSDSPPSDFENASGILTKFESVRASNLDTANVVAQKGMENGFKIWVDNDGVGKWTVIERTSNFSKSTTIANPEGVTNDSSITNFAESFSVDERNCLLAVGAPNDEDGKVYVYRRPSESVNWELLQVLEPITLYASTQRFGSSVKVSADGKYVIVGAPNASNVKTTFKGTYNQPTDYSAGDIVTYQNSYWSADTAIQGSESNITFNSFGNYDQIVYDLNLDEERPEELDLLLAGNYPFTGINADHFLVRAPKDIYEGIGVTDEVFLHWNKLTNANQTQTTLTDRQPFDGTIPYLNKSYLESNHTVSAKIDAILYVSQVTNIPTIGQQVTTQDASGIVAYTYQAGGAVTIYVNNVTGTLPDSNSLFIANNDFVGEYTLSGPSDLTFTATAQLGGYLMINTNQYAIGTTNVDSGRGLVIKDIIPDSVASNRYYYNSLDYDTAVVDSENTNHSFVSITSFTGSPGPNGTTGDFNSPYWVMRAPKPLTDTISPGSQLETYFSRLKRTVTTLTVNQNTSVVKGEVITQDNTNATATVFESVTLGTQIKVENVSGSFTTIDFLSGSQSGPLLVRPNSNPAVGTLVQPSDINLSFAITNKTQTVFDIWDGYIVYKNLFFLDGEPFEPMARYRLNGGVWTDFGTGQTVEDVTTGATGEVMFYERNFNDVKIYVKNVTGSWSKGDLFGDNAEIRMKAFPSGPDPDPFGRVAIYTVDRIMGQTQKTSLGYAPGNIGKLLVFDAKTNVAIPTSQEINNIEYWMYTTGTVNGIPRVANVPNSSNLDWTEVFKVTATTTGGQSSHTNEGLVYLYEKFGEQYLEQSAIVSPQRKGNHYFGSNVSLTKQGDIYRAFIAAYDEETTTYPGKIYFLKNGTENNNSYNWEYAKNKKFRGEFSSVQDYVTGDIVYLNDPQGTLYTAKTNITAGVFDALQWSSVDDLIDYVGFIPNDTGLKVVNDSSLDSVIDTNEMYDFGSEFDTSSDGEVLISTVKYTTKPNIVAVYRNKRGHYGWSQDIPAPTTGSMFGNGIAISNDGMYIAIGDPKDDTVKNDQGRVYIYKQVSGSFSLHQTLESPGNELAEYFGNKVGFDGTRLVVNARNADNFNTTTFDTNTLTFDKEFTKFRYESHEGGTIYVYEQIKDYLVYGHSLRHETGIDPETGQSLGPVYYFGRKLLLKNNHIYVGLPNVPDNTTTVGTLLDYRVPNKVFTEIRSAKDTVNLSKIKRVLLYNTKTKKIVKYLDYIDPIQGKIAGTAEENISFKLYYDPAVYTNGTATTVIDQQNPWTTTHVGELWWDLSNAKFYNAYQGDVTFSTNNWNKLFTTNTIDIYEWIETQYTPAEWDTLADTDDGLSQGISGKSKYGADVYTISKQYDEISQSFSNKYYFWVKDKKVKPDIEGRTLKATDVANLISDPASNAYQFAALFSNDSFAIYNCDKLLEDKNIAIGIQYWTIDNQTLNIHNQYQIITDGLETSKPNRDIEAKWIDSLVGYDLYGRIIPDPTLSEKEKYGNLNTPRQSWFVNRLEALKQYFERVNGVLAKELIVDSKDLSNLNKKEAFPSAVTNLYDKSVATVAELNLLGVAKAKQATMTVSVKDGKIDTATILDPGRGYNVTPTVIISGTGSDAEFKFTINTVGSITNVEIVNAGKNYGDTTSVEIRKYTVLVTADETISGKWSIYERNTTSNTWDRIRSQAYNTTLFWDYKDWYKSTYGPFTPISHVIDYAYQLDALDDVLDEVVRINNIGSGGWLLLRKIGNTIGADYTVNYETIGRQNGTIAFERTLYDTSTSFDGFDEISYDTKFYDSLPSTETRIITDAIKKDLFIEDLELEYNRLFFASLRYVLSEQQYVDWIFKTSFIKAKHNAGSLRKDLTFNNDNLPSYQSYIDEVKPFKTKLREYVSSYESLENANNLISDFDLPPAWNDDTKQIEPSSAKIIDGVLTGAESRTDVYPAKNWKDNLGFIVKEILIKDGGSGYTSPPVITITGGGGSGAKAITKLGLGGKVTAVEVTNNGTGYLSTPTLSLNGSTSDGGKDATLSLVIGQSLARSMHTIVKLDRTTGIYLITNLAESETYTGTGSKYVFDLPWPMDMKNTNVTVSVANTELLKSEYTYENILDVSKGYDRYFGRITLTQPAVNSSSVVVTYKKDISLLQAQDRINLVYDPKTGQYAKDLSQLMDGIDYGGVEVKSFDFGGPSGWDSAPWYTGSFDTYDTTFEDETITVDGSSTTITLSKALENGVLYNLYKNGVRLDDPDWVGDSTQFTNPNAIMRSITGDGTTNTIYLQDLGVSVVADDIITIRKTTSDGSFLPTDISYDTQITGGDLAYTTAKGLNPEDIDLDGDGFTTPTNSKGPEELVPGWVQDTLDIKIYERPTTGASQVISRNYTGDGTTKIFSIGTKPVTESALLVKVNNILKKITTDYTINYATGNVEFVTAPTTNHKINFVSLEYSGAKILDIDEFIGDGSTVEFLTNIRYTENMSSLVTIDGKKVEHVLIKSTSSYIVPNNVVINFAEPPKMDAVVRFAIFEGIVQNFSNVTIDNLEHDGSSTSYQLTQTPFTETPHEWFTIVQLNNQILNSGYSESFTVSATREYRMRLYQTPTASLRNDQLRVYLNGQEIHFPTDWTFSAADAFDPLKPLDQQLGSTILLNDSVGVAGDSLRVYVTGWDDSTMSGGDYRFGYFDSAGDFVSTPGQLHLSPNVAVGDKITVYQFSNHDSQGIDRQSFDVKERTLLSSGTQSGSQTYQLDGSTSELTLSTALEPDFSYSVFLNNVRLDDPNFGTGNPVSNVNAIMKTITPLATTNVIQLQNLGINTNVGDILKIVELNAAIVPDASTPDWYELRNLRNGYVPLNSPAVDDQYVWVIKNGVMLDPSVDYFVTTDKTRVKVIGGLAEDDNIQTIHFSNTQLRNKFGWRQFKDILNRTHYKVLDGTKNIKLVKDLKWYDKDIQLENYESLPQPNINTKNPGVIFIDGERIEYFIKDGNKLKQLRRGTMGTGVKDNYTTGTEVYNQSATSTLPYRDETYSTVFTADGTSKVYVLDFTPSSTNEFEVFVAGKRLRKTTLASYEMNTANRTAYATASQDIAQDSPEGDVTLPAEFSLQNTNELVLLNVPSENQKVIVVRRIGKTWTNSGKTLSNSDSDIARFLRSTQVDLPR